MSPGIRINISYLRARRHGKLDLWSFLGWRRRRLQIHKQVALDLLVFDVDDAAATEDLLAFII